MERKNGKGARMAAVINDYEDGLTVKEIAEKRSLATKTVKEYLRQHKYDTASEYHQKKMEETEARAEVMAQELADGMSIQEIADRHGIDHTSVTLALRFRKVEAMDHDALYKQVICSARTSRYIRQWAKDKAGRILRTPDGEMVVTQIYPHMMVCTNLKQKVRTTYMNWQLYYMNGGR